VLREGSSVVRGSAAVVVTHGKAKLAGAVHKREVKSSSLRLNLAHQTPSLYSLGLSIQGLRRALSASRTWCPSAPSAAFSRLATTNYCTGYRCSCEHRATPGTSTTVCMSSFFSTLVVPQQLFTWFDRERRPALFVDVER